MRLPAGGNCSSKNLIYAARCRIHDEIYIGHTGDEIKERFHKHRYDAKSRPENSELAEHFSKDQHNFDKDIDVTILKHDLFTKEEREYHEDRMICMLGTKSPSGINQTTKAYGREVYAFAQKLLQWRQLKNTSLKEAIQVVWLIVKEDFRQIHFHLWLWQNDCWNVRFM